MGTVLMWSTEMNNRVAFIDFVRGLLCINPMERWSPQQAKMHPFITQAKYTGPFVPPMNLKNNSPLQKGPMSPAEQQQRAQEAARQKQAAAQQAAAQQAAAAQAAQQQQQASPAYNSSSAYHSPSTSQPVYNNLYSTSQQQYSNPSINFTQSQPQVPSQQSQYAGNPNNLYATAQANNARNNQRQRSTTMMGDGGIPPQIQRAASMMDPNHPIRLQPSPAYFPPPPGSHPEEGGMGQGRGRQGRRNVVRNLEGTLEEGMFGGQRWQ